MSLTLAPSWFYLLFVYMLQYYEVQNLNDLHCIRKYDESSSQLFTVYMHFLLCSFSSVMSENYIVFIEQPIKLNMLKFMLYRIQGKAFHKVMTWEPQYETIFHLVNRHTGQVCCDYCTNTHTFPELQTSSKTLHA